MSHGNTSNDTLVGYRTGVGKGKDVLSPPKTSFLSSWGKLRRPKRPPPSLEVSLTVIKVPSASPSWPERHWNGRSPGGEGSTPLTPNLFPLLTDFLGYRLLVVLTLGWVETRWDCRCCRVVHQTHHDPCGLHWVHSILVYPKYRCRSINKITHSYSSTL